MAEPIKSDPFAGDSECFRAMVEAQGVGLWEYDHAAARVSLSPALRRLLAVDQVSPPLTPDDWLALVHPEDRADLRALLDAMSAPGADGEAPFRIRSGDDRWRWVLGRGAVVAWDAAGQPRRSAGILVDVGGQASRAAHQARDQGRHDPAHTRPLLDRPAPLASYCQDHCERLRAADALRHLQEEQELILDSVPAMIWYKDADNRILRVNAAAARSLGLPKDRIEGRHTADFFPEEAARYYQDDLRVIRTGEPCFGIEESYRLPSGERRWIRTDKVPLRDDSGVVNRVLVMSLDITERRRAEDALREADRRKDEFLATLAHELRNPLAPISHAVQILRLSAGDADTLAWCNAVIERQLEHLRQLVDDLLDVSRISRGKIALQRTVLNLDGVLQRALETCRPALEHQAQRLVQQSSPEPLHVEGDMVRLAQVVSNLLGNAIKYSHRGARILLAARREGEQAVIRVRDEGIGIPVAMLTRIFDLFVQLERPGGQVREGLGIGLNLARQLVHLHGGTIEARSEGEGRGSEFLVRLPLVAAPVVTPSVVGGVSGRPRRHRILVADDNQDGAKSLAMLLEILGQEVRIAHDGQEAVELAAAFVPELILMDIGMPRLNGCEACLRIRAERATQAALIVALTGWGQDRHRKESSAAGFDLHLIKPLGMPQLTSLLERLRQAPGECPAGVRALARRPSPVVPHSI